MIWNKLKKLFEPRLNIENHMLAYFRADDIIIQQLKENKKEKYCVNCKFYKYYDDIEREELKHRCQYNKIKHTVETIDLITGVKKENIILEDTCLFFRNLKKLTLKDNCGVEGKFYEPK